MRLPAKHALMLAIFAIVALALSARADDGFTIVSVKINQNNRKLVYVRFEGPGPKPEDITNKDDWQVQVVNASGFETEKVENAAPFEPYVNTHTAKITLQAEVPTTFQSINVTYKPVNGAQGSGTPTSTTHSTIVPADGKDDANLYLKGSVSHSGSAYTYSVDAATSLVLHAFGEAKTSDIEFNGTVSADSDELGDPDSVDLSLTVRRGAHGDGKTKFLGFDTYGYSAQVDVFTVQSDKETDVVDLLASPKIRLPLFHIFWKRKADGQIESDVPLGTLSLVPSLGVEGGWNARNEISVASGPPHGTGGVLRGVPGARLTFSWASSPALNRVVFSSDYTARILAREELFQETRGVLTPVPSLRAGTRHYVKNSIDLMINKYAGLNFSHEYGSLPPTFKFLDQRLTFGVVFALKQDFSK